MPDYDAYEHFSPRRNAKADFEKSRDWVAQQEILLSEEQKSKYELLKRKQFEDQMKLKNELNPKNYQKKRYQPKPRLIPESQRLRTNKKKIEVVKIEPAQKQLANLKKQHEEQKIKFLKKIESERHKENTKGNSKDNARAKAFDVVRKKQSERNIEKVNDRDKGNSR